MVKQFEKVWSLGGGGVGCGVVFGQVGRRGGGGGWAEIKRAGG